MDVENALFLWFHHKMFLKGNLKGDLRGDLKKTLSEVALEENVVQIARSDLGSCSLRQRLFQSGRADRMNTQLEHGNVGLATRTSKSHVIWLLLVWQGM